ncbi:NAD(P)-dependent oxidoreductase [Devosia algicola]|uniref:NAD(P)-dependent oxidoreductase n=1 Tax=Devosia algicola TaxID=3026418 RepID=A0ABY7YLK8_9HYPH|nr:NAD(P)-dependent oxidoreductase [Devosia algicola]WDR02174.1 NAD(P)-dependent oxidoreductase [Devosia algicola]
MKVVLYGSPVANRRDWLADQLGPGFAVETLSYDAPVADKAKMMAGASALIGVRFDLPDAKKLTLVQVPGAGCDEVDLSLLADNTTLCNVHGHDAAVAEFVVLQMLQWCHRADSASTEFRAGSWARSSRFGATPHKELSGSVVGIVGYGGIGRAVADRLRAFGVTVLAANRSPVDPRGLDGVYRLDQLEEMFARCDFGVLCVGLAPETHHLIGAVDLAALGPDGVLVNVARGGIVNQNSLWQQLSSGQLGGAILDVWYQYPSGAADRTPPARHPFLERDNVMPTPHIAGWTQGTVARRWADILENVRRIGTTQAFLNVVKEGRS